MIDRELDALVAEKVMGFRVERYEDGSPTGVILGSSGMSMVVPDYSTDIRDAWPVFDRLGPAWQISQSDPGGYDKSRRWWCWLPEEYGGVRSSRECETMEATAPRAICIAALKAAGVEIPE